MLCFMLVLQCIPITSHAVAPTNQKGDRTPRWRNYINWMNDAWPEIKDTRYCDMVLIGTHDAGTYSLDYFDPFQIEEGLADTLRKVSKVPGVWDIAKDFTRQLTHTKSVTQDVNIYDQLMEGNRLLDLRLKKFNGDGLYRTFHGMFGADLEDIVTQLKDFIRDSSDKEIIYINFNQFGFQWDMTAEDKADLGKKFHDALGQYIFTPEEFSFTKTMGELAATGKRIVLSTTKDYESSLHPTLAGYYLPQAQHSSQDMAGSVLPNLRIQYNNAYRTTTDQKKLDQWYEMKVQLSWVASEDLDPVLAKLKKADIIGATKLFERNIGLSLEYHTKRGLSEIAQNMIILGATDDENQPNIWSRDFYTQQEVGIAIMRNFGKNKALRDVVNETIAKDYKENPYNESSSNLYRLIENARFDAGEKNLDFADPMRYIKSDPFGIATNKKEERFNFMSPYYMNPSAIKIDANGDLNGITFTMDGEDYTFGTADPGHRKTIQLAKDEYITKILLTSSNDNKKITYASIATNKGQRIEGGNRTNNAKSFQPPKNWNIYGIGGYAGGGNFKQLYFYYRPAPIGVQKAFREDSFGGSQGFGFDTSLRIVDNLSSFNKVVINSVRRVDGLDLYYEDGYRRMIGVPTKETALELQKGEYITEMTVDKGVNKGETNIFYLELKTNKGRSISGGTPTGDRKIYTAPQGYFISGFYGKRSEDIDRLGPVYQLLPIEANQEN